MTTIHAAQALVAGRLVGPVRLELDGPRIASVVTGKAAEQGSAADIELRSGTLTPGLLDLQNNGSFGADFAEATPEQWADVLTGLASRGVTGLEPTIITAPLAELNEAFDRIHAAQQRHADEPVCRILGAHLEGPFISEQRKGAHRAECMLDPTSEALDTLLDNPATAAVLLTVTLAPERQHAMAAIRRLTAQGVVVSVGHSDATAEQVWAAADAGATMTTHIFNAQRPLQHREPGVAGAVLADERYFIGVIIDGQHLHPSTVKIVYSAAPGRAIGVTDAIVTAGLPNHTPLMFGGQPVANDDAGVGRRPDGTIAGAGIVLDEAVRRMVAAGLDPALVLASCTEVAARSLRRTDIGQLTPRALADLVWWDEQWYPQGVWVGGTRVPTSEQVPA
ncbi:MAG: amidohydrolase family protein [Candidatus Nanopelagicales bacterium]